MEDLTKEELSAISALRRIEKRWPETLWLFATGMTIHVMRKKSNGDRAVLPCGGMDPDYEVARVTGIENDGGDW